LAGSVRPHANTQSRLRRASPSASQDLSLQVPQQSPHDRAIQTHRHSLVRLPSVAQRSAVLHQSGQNPAKFRQHPSQFASRRSRWDRSGRRYLNDRNHCSCRRALPSQVHTHRSQPIHGSIGRLGLI